MGGVSSGSETLMRLKRCDKVRGGKAGRLQSVRHESTILNAEHSQIHSRVRQRLELHDPGMSPIAAMTLPERAIGTVPTWVVVCLRWCRVRSTSSEAERILWSTTSKIIEVLEIIAHLRIQVGTIIVVA